MARPLRVEFPGAFYHVINRGNRICSGVGPRQAFESTKEPPKKGLALGLKTRSLTPKKGFFFGTDCADDTDLILFVVVAGNQAPDFLLRTILRKEWVPVY